MAKKRARPPTKRAGGRNPLARAVREGIYRKPRVVAREDRYLRRPKHRKPGDMGDGEA